ncbi:BURP domain-containing protein BNM2C-like [Salvia miltiorrhiza]|uniref:BURP domain-containing protein BNM2C-like n=1 Tax=Salvia miltiorrhiza TaxID=226208 RepID=UPI0025AC4D88|nr:BURP domain-containing protein BNM2C-like [Salvia miltiorrhiza]
MDVKLPLCSLLTLLAVINGNGLNKMDMRIEQVHSASPHMHHHMDPTLVVFFFQEDLKVGNTIPIHFPSRDLNSVSARLLPKEEADSIPFSSHQLDHLLDLYSFPRGSPQATAMEDTLRQCETKPVKGETKTCPTSWDSMLDFATSILGSSNEIRVLATTHITRASGVLQKYTITGIEEYPASKVVACHTMPYPYVVFYCHYQESQSRVFRVSLTGENGDRVEAVAVCHMDTSQWSPNHVSFKVLGVEPGFSPVCHFFPADNFVVVP